MIAGAFGLITFTALGWALYNVFAATTRSLTALAAQNWHQYVGVDAGNTLAFLYRCADDTLCAPILGSQWVQHYSFLPLYVFPPALIATIIAARLAHRPTDKKAPGQGHWGTTEELKREGYFKSKTNTSVRGYFGIHRDSRKMLQLPEHIRYSHCLVIGGPGARKSTGYHKQNIIQDLKDEVNIIVFDLKYPDPRGGFFDMVTLAADHYGYDVQLMLPYDKTTHRYSLLAKASTETGAREVASMILPPGQGSEGSEFYRNNERIILTGLILAAARKESGSLKEIVDALRLGYKGMSAYVRAAEDPDVATMISTVLDGVDVEKQKGIINGLLGKLEIFGDPDLLAFGQLGKDPRENIDLRRFANAKTILYIGVPQQKLGSYGQMFLQLIKRSIDKELGEISRENAGVFPIPISYYLDEFANFGPLPDIGADFATMRSRRLSYHVTVQNMAQGAAVYGHQEWESFYRSNFQSVLIFPRYIRFGDADLFSKFAGNLTTIEQSTSDSKSNLDSRTSVNTREVSRPLMSTEEMKEWPQAEGVAFLNGVAPVRVVLPRLDEAQVRGYKNPYHDDYKRVPDRLNPYQWVRDYFDRYTADRRRHILEAKLQEAQARSAQARSRCEHDERTRALELDAQQNAPGHEGDNEPPILPAPPATTTPAPQPPAPRAAPTKQPREIRTGATAHAPTERPKGAKRFNLLIASLVNARIAPSVIKVSKGKRLLELAFPHTPDINARLEPHRELLVTHSKFLAYRGDEVALTRAGLTHLAENLTAYYYRLGVKPLSRQQRAALADPQGPSVQVPISHNAFKTALRKEIRRLAKHKHLTWRGAGNTAALAAPIGQVDGRKLHIYGAYWKQYGLAVERDGLLHIKTKALVGLPQPALEALPPQPRPQPKTKPAPQAQPAPADGKPRGNDPRAAARHLNDDPLFPEGTPADPGAQDDSEDAAKSVELPQELIDAFGAPLEDAEEAPPALSGEAAAPAGLKPIPEDLRRPVAQIVEPGHEQDSSADTVALIEDGFDRSDVLNWVEENKALLAGHADAAPDLDERKALGRYTRAHHLITVEAAHSRLEFAGLKELPASVQTVTHRMGGRLTKWALLDPAATTTDTLVLLAATSEGLVGDDSIRLECMLELPLDVAKNVLPRYEWSNVLARRRGARAWVRVFVAAPQAAPKLAKEFVSLGA